MPNLVLASSSPRRALLLSAAGYSITRRIPDIDETALPDEAPEQTVIRLAREKALSPVEEDTLVLGADTTVVLDGDALGKPTDRDHAMDMLHRLAGRTHAVVTGWAVAIAEQAQQRLCARFRRLAARGKERNKVTVAVARELVGFIWATLSHDKPETT